MGAVSLMAPGQRRSDAGAPPDALTGPARRSISSSAFFLPGPTGITCRPTSLLPRPDGRRGPTTRPAAIGSCAPWPQRSRAQPSGRAARGPRHARGGSGSSGLRTAAKISRRGWVGLGGVALSAVRGLATRATPFTEADGGRPSYPFLSGGMKKRHN